MLIRIYSSKLHMLRKLRSIRASKKVRNPDRASSKKAILTPTLQCLLRSKMVLGQNIIRLQSLILHRRMITSNRKVSKTRSSISLSFSSYSLLETLTVSFRHLTTMASMFRMPGLSGWIKTFQTVLRAKQSHFRLEAAAR